MVAWLRILRSFAFVVGVLLSMTAGAALAGKASGVELVFAKPTSERALARMTARRFDPEVAYRIEFRAGDLRISQRSAATLDKLATWIIANPTMPFAILGQADPEGAGADNLELAIDRAENVARYLMSKGVAVERVQQAWSLGAQMTEAGGLSAMASSSDASPKSRPSGNDGSSRNDNRDKSKNGNKGRN